MMESRSDHIKGASYNSVSVPSVIQKDAHILHEAILPATLATASASPKWTHRVAVAMVANAISISVIMP